MKWNEPGSRSPNALQEHFDGTSAPSYEHVKGDRIAELSLITDIVFKAYDTDPAECTMVEIGSFKGESTAFWCDKFKKVYAVDPWANGYDGGDPSSQNELMSDIENIFDKRTMAHQESEKLVKIKGTSMEAVKLFKDKTLDFVYIDGNHMYNNVREDIDHWRHKTKILAGHDFGWIDSNGVNSVFKACMDFFDRPPDGVLPDTSWVYDLEKYRERTMWVTTRTMDLLPCNSYKQSWMHLLPNYKGVE